MKFEKIWVGTEHNYGIDHRISDGILTVIYDTCYSLYELDKDGIIWLLMSEDNDLGELIQSIEVSFTDLLELADIDIASNWVNLSDHELKEAVIKAYSALWENQINHPHKDMHLELLENFRNAKYFDFNNNCFTGYLQASYSDFDLV